MKWLCLFLSLWLSQTALAADFINLDFESVVQPLPPPDPVEGTLPAELVLPGWHVPLTGSQSDVVFYNNTYLDSVSVSVYSSSYDPFGVIQGNYTVRLYSGLTSPLPTGADAIITQTGLVPIEAHFLELKVGLVGGPFAVSLGGEDIAMTAIETGPNYIQYVGDITGHSGLEEELQISVPYTGIAPSGQAHAIYLDDIVFSPVPEPVTWVLLGLGAFGLMGMRIRRSRRL
jgi:PEP-CTERM motif